MAPEKQNNLWKYAGYVLLTAVLTLYFFFLTFPFEALKDHFLSQSSGRLPYHIAMEHIGATPFLWVKCSGLEISDKANKSLPPLIAFETLKLKPAWLRLLMGQPALRVKGELYSGKIKGTAAKKKEDLDISLAWKDIELADYPLLTAKELGKIKGALSGKFLLRMNQNRWYAGDGTLTCQLEEGSFQELKIRGFTLPTLEGITGQGVLSLGQQKAILESFTINSDQLSSAFDGKIDLKPVLNRSRLNVDGKLKLTGEMAEQYQPMLSGLLRNKDDQDFYTFTLKGSLSKPRFSF